MRECKNYNSRTNSKGVIKSHLDVAMTASSQGSSLDNFNTQRSNTNSDKERISNITRQTSFNAYPLECSQNLINPTNEVIYMPLNPTNVPLSLQPASISGETQNELPQSYSHPICHGFIFPNSLDALNNVDVVQTNVQNVQQRPTSSSYNIKNPLQSLQFGDMDFNAQRHFYLLLLQELIGLQLSEHHNTVKSTIPLQSQSNIQSQNQEPLPCNVQNFGLNEHPNQNWAVNSEHSDMSTFLVPVEAKFEGESGLSLHITPRDDSSNTSQKGSVTVECPGQPIVLYPYTVQHDGTQEETSPVSQSITDSNASGPTAQALTIKDIHQCVRRGSLEFPPEPGNVIVENMRGHTRPGFVLLSVRHEKINSENKTSPTADCGCEEAVSPSLPPVNPEVKLKRSSKKRFKHTKGEADLKRRSVGRLSKSVLKNMRDENISQRTVELTEEDLKALSSQSRFRVTRFADKKQAWIAPANAGCSVVHDLWTTKLPEYVLKCAKHLKHPGPDFLVQKCEYNEVFKSMRCVLDGRCEACQKLPHQC
uniref:Uncharacterized protein n=1 Tax=Trichobilharzia regenti TaxID=157069 RepID=A0AA85K6D4_TRIRE|nr:unnamed protein product [Trichobilharzia regenti]